MLAIKIAIRYLFSAKSHSAVNIIAFVAVTGVAIATMAMVIVLSIFNGFSDLAAQQLSKLDPELEVIPNSGGVITDGDSLAKVLASVPGVEVAVPTLTERGLIVTQGGQLPVVFKGVGVGYERLTDIDEVIIDGTYDRANTAGIPAMQISIGVANALLAAPSPTALVNLYVPRREGRINPANSGAAFRQSELVISGVFQVNNSDVDADHIIIPLETARELLARDTEVTAIELRGAPGGDVDKLAAAVRSVVGDKYIVRNRLEQRAEAFRMISVEKWVTFMMLVFILVITLFNVVSTLSLLVIEKRDNMATLRALGAGNGLIRRVFIVEGLLVTMAGGVIGIILGVGISLAQQWGHIVKLSADAAALTIDYYPVRVSGADIILVAAVIAVTALIVSQVTRFFVRFGKVNDNLD